jgi:two-component system chemotaxis response regulator CheY
VDDDAAIRRMVNVILRLNNVAVDLHEAESAADALAATERHDFDLVLFDLRMPVVDGLTFAREIKARPELRGLRLCLATSCHEATALEAAREMGVNDLLLKPFRPKDLVTLVRSLSQAPV